MVNEYGNTVRVIAPGGLDEALPKSQPETAKLGVTMPQKDGSSRYVRLDMDQETLLIGPYCCVGHAERASILMAALLQVHWQKDPEFINHDPGSCARVLH